MEMNATHPPASPLVVRNYQRGLIAFVERVAHMNTMSDSAAARLVARGLSSARPEIADRYWRGFVQASGLVRPVGRPDVVAGIAQVLEVRFGA